MAHTFDEMELKFVKMTEALGLHRLKKTKSCDVKPVSDKKFVTETVWRQIMS